MTIVAEVIARAARQIDNTGNYVYTFGQVTELITAYGNVRQAEGGNFVPMAAAVSPSGPPPKHAK